MYYISDLKKALEYFGLKMSIDQIRKLEKAGIVFSSRNKKNFYREFTKDQFKLSVKNILLYYFNTPIEDIKKDDIETIKERITKIMQATKLLRGIYV